MACSKLKKFVANWRKELVGLAVLVGVVSVVLFVLWLFGQITFVKQEVTIVKIITGLLILVGMYWTSRRVLAAEKTVRVAEEGQITERFTKAIAQLGDKEMAIRLGGIYALERIAKDSEKDHGPIMEVLTAYVRENATKEGKYAEEAVEKPTSDIQAILTVIGRRKPTAVRRLRDFLDLSDTHLAGAVLNQANLSGVNLYEADLYGAVLNEANLSRAILSRANLNAAILSGAKNLTAEQVLSADNWREAHLPDDLQYLLTEPPA